ncbi:C2H2 finger domain protein [Rasamsonia emersonii CBS 393.64]|uniref:C2H2 finger domain protein n=1 Tax=Rasamsonia emersonii (strain ATCC 16479 / CBS 393.64 / IMI 116815) TaxID=1408163 RepID=A0A0F4YMF8_RASE3|nr:C2H2 finger domain protein [Rasamsonia emersonii CBS 393.64]KKA19472.1 C2H2 finger domain protein [Rasamsonia emersonii CBS 393.64]
MSSCPNVPYNPYRYGAADSEQDLAQFSTSRQPPLPTQGFGDAPYDCKTQQSSAGASGLNDHQFGNYRSPYSGNNDVYAHQQGFSSHHQSGDLPSITTSPVAARSQASYSQDNSGLNSLIYVSALESAVRKNQMAQSRTPKSAENHARKDSFQSQARTSQPSNAARSSSSFGGSQQTQMPGRSPPVMASSSVPPSYQNYYSNYRSPYPNLASSNSGQSVISNDSAANGVSTYNRVSSRGSEGSNHQPSCSSPLTSTIPTASRTSSHNNQVSSNNSRDFAAYSNPDQFNRQAISSSTSAFTQSIPVSSGSMRNPQLQSPPQPSMAHKFPNGSPSSRIDMAFLTEANEPPEQISPPRVQYINPNELYLQQYRQEQEHLRAAEMEAGARREQDKSNRVPSAQPQSSNQQPSTSDKPTTSSTKEASQPASSSSAQQSEQELEEDMATEMKAMLEKLRKWRSKDPALFTKLWEDLKKGQTSGQTAPASKAPAQGEQQSAKTSPAPAAAAPATAPASTMATASTMAPSSAPAPVSAPAPASASAPAPVAAPAHQKAQKGQGHLIDGLPDLGRFPAQRRRRTSKITDNAHQTHGGNQTLVNGTSGQPLAQPSTQVQQQPTKTSAVPNATPTASQTVTSRPSTQAVTGPGQMAQQPSPDPANRIDGLPDLSKRPDISKAGKVPQGSAVETSGSVLSPVSMAPTTANAMQVGQTPNVSRPPLPDQKASVPPPPRPTPQGQPAPNRTADTAWPVVTQRRLAQAIVDYLATEPANKNKIGSIEAILSLLRNNPTYPELCEKLESLGFALHRQNMARYLIKAVPDLNANNSPQPPSQPPAQPPAQEQKRPESNVEATSRSPQPPPPQALEASQVLPPRPIPQTQPMQPPKPPAPHMIMWNSKKSSSAPIPKVSTTPRAGPSSDTSSSGPGSSAQAVSHPSKPAPSRSSLSTPPASSPAPSSKAAAARKRLFSEIVDLSQLSDDEDTEPPKQPRLEEVPLKDPLAPVEEPSGQAPGELNQPQPRDVPVEVIPPQPGTETNQPTPGAAEGPRPDFSHFALESSQEPTRGSIRKRPDLVQPLKDSAALDRLYYNPKTIARDILIAAGRHPTERPLNYHLIQLQKNFPCVSSKADLETFRWDIVDPGGPPMPIVEPEDILTYPPPVPRKRRAEKKSRDAHDAASGDKTPPASPSNKAPDQPSPHQPQHSTTSFIQYKPKGAEESTMAGAGSSDSAPRRPGRPPGSKNKQPSKSSLKAPKIEVAIPVPPQVPSPSYPILPV